MEKDNESTRPSGRWFGIQILPTVKGRIIAGFGLGILFLVVVASGSAWMVREQQSDLAEMEGRATTASLLKNSQLNVNLAAAALQRYVIVGDEAQAAGDEELLPEIDSSVAMAVEDLMQALAQEEARGDEEQIVRLKEISAEAASLAEGVGQVIALRQSGDAQAMATLETMVVPFREFRLALDEAAEAEFQEVSALRSQADRTGDLALWLLVISGAAGVAVGLAMSILIARSILKPLSSLESTALAVAGGDLETRAPAAGPRELAHLGASLNQMTESLLDASKRRELEAERERALAQLRESEEKFRGLLESAPDAVVIANDAGRIVLVNAQTEETFGYSRDELLGKPVEILVPERLRKSHVGHRADYHSNPHTRPIGSGLELTAQRKDGSDFPVAISLSPQKTKDGVLITSIIHDITERKRAEEELQRLNQQLKADRQAIEELNRSLEEKVKERTQEIRLANEELRERNRQLLDARTQAATDALTGLSNHRAFHERLGEEVSRGQETGSPVGLIMLDIDGFKRFNDSLGHLAGDEILRGLARTLADVAPREDSYRYGGDEFAVLLPGADCRKAGRIAERLRRAVAKTIDGDSKSVTVSLGIACFPDTAASAEELVYSADAAMYWAKSAGKNRVGDWSKLVKSQTDGALPWYAADRSVEAPDVIAALVAALAAKDPTTSAHTKRCSWYSAKLARELGLGEKETSIVRLASLLHDIGKLAVPDELLCKPGPLNDEEWVQMKRHSTAALDILGQIRSITDAIPAILHHHEHFDGSGYPDGLAGDDIPVASRILLVTDAFDAMTTDRPYRKAMPIETAIEELTQNSGSQFDPAVVDAFLRILSCEETQLPSQSTKVRARTAAAGAPGSRRTER